MGEELQVCTGLLSRGEIQIYMGLLGREELQICTVLAGMGRASDLYLAVRLVEKNFRFVLDF